MSKLEDLVNNVTRDREQKERNVKPLPTSALSRLGLRARSVAEGLLAGQHQSNQYGQNIEFADYREYVPGDDLRHIDWRAYARCERLYIKRFEAETAMRAMLVVDLSHSMNYGEGTHLKVQYACELAATLAAIIITQKDSVGLAVYNESVGSFLAPAGGAGQLRRICSLLEKQKVEGETRTGPVLENVAARLNRRGFLILISDFWDDINQTLAGLAHFAHRRFEVLVLQLLTPEERDFPFMGSLEIEGLENQGMVQLDGRSTRKSYLKKLADHQELLRGGCSNLGVDYHLISTADKMEDVVAGILIHRRRFAG